MTEQTPRETTPSCPEVVFRSITPVFNHQIDGAPCFTHSGKNRDASFNIELRPYTANPENSGEVTLYASDGIRQLLRERSIHFSNHFFSHAAHFLIVDLEYPAGIVSDTCVGTQECSEVLLATLEALRLHSSSGLIYHETYHFRTNSSAQSGLGITATNALQNRFSRLPSPSTLIASEFGACRATIDMFLTWKWSATINRDNVLNLAKEYHRTSFNLEHVAHAFLILMIVFEALFKKDENSSGKAASSIGRLLGHTQKACSTITREFDDGADSFREIRNQIAHGDTGLNEQTVSRKYQSLYRYVTDALVKLLALPPGQVDNTKDYYDEIARITDQRYASLPRKQG
jgi:hypothetical protein